jgi:aldose 1-epimerase
VPRTRLIRSFPQLPPVDSRVWGDYCAEAVQFTTLRVASPDGLTVAEYASDAGMVCASLKHQGEELLASGKGLEAYVQRGATMGIPLLYPWANRLEGLEYRTAGTSVTLPADRTAIALDPNGLPIHGVVPGRMRWQPEHRDDEATLAARLKWTSDDLLALFPFAHELRMQATVETGSLTIVTMVSAIADCRVPISFGYHPYLRLPGGNRDSWHVQIPPSQRLVLDERLIPTRARTHVEHDAFDLAGTSLDDAFAIDAQPARFTVSAGGRGLAVELLEGFRYGQIYAPADHDFVCFEPMTAPTNALVSGDGLRVLAPGEEYRAAFRIVAWQD